jgi:hypothetical protein
VRRYLTSTAAIKTMSKFHWWWLSMVKNHQIHGWTCTQ